MALLLGSNGSMITSSTRLAHHSGNSDRAHGTLLLEEFHFPTEGATGKGANNDAAAADANMVKNMLHNPGFVTRCRNQEVKVNGTRRHVPVNVITDMRHSTVMLTNQTFNGVEPALIRRVVTMQMFWSNFDSELRASCMLDEMPTTIRALQVNVGRQNQLFSALVGPEPETCVAHYFFTRFHDLYNRKANDLKRAMREYLKKLDEIIASHGIQAPTASEVVGMGGGAASNDFMQSMGFALALQAAQSGAAGAGVHPDAAVASDVGERKRAGNSESDPLWKHYGLQFSPQDRFSLKELMDFYKRDETRDKRVLTVLPIQAASMICTQRVTQFVMGTAAALFAPLSDYHKSLMISALSVVSLGDCVRTLATTTPFDSCQPVECYTVPRAMLLQAASRFVVEALLVEFRARMGRPLCEPVERSAVDFVVCPSLEDVVVALRSGNRATQARVMEALCSTTGARHFAMWWDKDVRWLVNLGLWAVSFYQSRLCQFSHPRSSHNNANASREFRRGLPLAGIVSGIVRHLQQAYDSTGVDDGMEPEAAVYFSNTHFGNPETLRHLASEEDIINFGNNKDARYCADRLVFCASCEYGALFSHHYESDALAALLPTAEYLHDHKGQLDFGSYLEGQHLLEDRPRVRKWREGARYEPYDPNKLYAKVCTTL